MAFPITSLPEFLLENVFSYISYDQVAKMRIVCKYFDQVCQRHLNRGFQKVEKIQSQYLKELRAKLPRRESARRHHRYARHCDILTAIDTRMNLLSLSFGKYIEANLCCFIPGKIIDEIYNVLEILKTNSEPPSTYEVLQELRDISSMAMEHFDDKIVPGLMKKHQNAASTSTSSITSAVLIPTLSFSSPITTTPNSRASKFKDELLAHKRQTLEMLNKHSQSIKKGKKTLQKALQKQSQKIEKLEETINAQASLIESQNEMMKELNKKLLENEQKLSDFFTAKEVVGRKRHADEDLNEAHDEKSNGEPAAKKMKT